MPTDSRGIKRSGGPLVVPEVNAVMVSRMDRVHFEDPLEKRVHGFMALDLHAIARVGPELVSQQGPSLQVIGKLVKDLFKGLGVGLGFRGGGCTTGLGGGG